MQLTAPNTRTQRGANKFDSEDCGLILNIKNRIHFDEIHTDQLSRFGDYLTSEMRLTIGQPARDGRPHTWRVTRVERIHIEGEVDTIDLAADTVYGFLQRRDHADA